MRIIRNLLVVSFVLVILSCSNNKTSETVGVLPKPQISGGKPLMLALRDRRTLRDFSDKELSMQQLSNLLWAANGINRADEKKHTAPTAMNKQELEIYVAIKSGVYLFDADNQKLNKVIDTDIRAQIGAQQFHKIAPVNLLIVADLDKVFGNDTTKVYNTLDAGYISQNIYLYCASENLATVAVGMVNRDQVASLLHFTNRKQIILAHPVGFKKE